MKHLLKYTFLAVISFFVFFIILSADSSETNIYQQRRLKFIDKMETGVAVFAGNKSINYSGEAEYEFRQNADFYYLTGYDKPAASLILVKGKENKSILFIDKPSPFLEIYNGPELSIDEVKKKYGFTEVYYNEEFDEIFESLPLNQNKIYYSFNDDELNDKINSLFDSPYGKPKEVINSEIITKDLRVIKDAEEIKLLQKAIDITNAAQFAVWEKVKPGMNESGLAALIEYTYRINGAPRNGFPSIVGSGKNSCVLHYGSNNQIIKDNVTIVLDIGAEYGNYSADVTRTIPSNGKFTKQQKEIYNIVLDAQTQAIEIIKPGIKLSDIHNKTFGIIEKELYKLGLVTDTTKKLADKIMGTPHGSSHWLGLDTHDAGDYNFKEGGRELEPGMVFTVEPGIYISENVFKLADKLPSGFIPKDELPEFKEDIKGAFEKYKNIGVRIEDDILVTGTGYKNLSAESPRTIEEIERMMNK